MKEILLLEKGDIINNGDLFFTVTGRGWQPVEKIDFGQKVESRFEQPVIRRVSNPATTAAGQKLPSLF